MNELHLNLVADIVEFRNTFEFCRNLISANRKLNILKHSVAAVLVGILDSGSYWIWYLINNQALPDRFNTCLL